MATTKAKSKRARENVIDVESAIAYHERHARPARGTLMTRYTPDDIPRADAIPDARKLTDIVRVGNDTEIRAYVCSRSVRGFYTHWDGRRTAPCTKPKRPCELCKRELAVRWYGYLTCCRRDGGDVYFLEVTAESVKPIKKLLTDGKPIRGIEIAARRKRRDKRGPISIEVVNANPVHLALPDERDPIETLLRLWGVPTGT